MGKNLSLLTYKAWVVISWVGPIIYAYEPFENLPNYNNTIKEYAKYTLQFL